MQNLYKIDKNDINLILCRDKSDFTFTPTRSIVKRFYNFDFNKGFDTDHLKFDINFI